MSREDEDLWTREDESPRFCSCRALQSQHSTHACARSKDVKCTSAVWNRRHFEPLFMLEGGRDEHVCALQVQTSAAHKPILLTDPNAVLDLVPWQSVGAAENWSGPSGPRNAIRLLDNQGNQVRTVCVSVHRMTKDCSRGSAGVVGGLCVQATPLDLDQLRHLGCTMRALHLGVLVACWFLCTLHHVEHC